MRSVLVTLALASLPVMLAPGAAQAEGATKCIRFSGEARYGALGYNHLVHITNACDASAECEVATDVNPEPQRVEVPGRTSVVVTTFLGSPARTFTPRVACTMRAE